MKSKLQVLRHISKRNCALLPYLNDESLHTLGEFIFNIINQRVSLDQKQLKKVKSILKKDKSFYKKLIHVDTSNPLGYSERLSRLNLKLERVQCHQLQHWLHLQHPSFCDDMLFSKQSYPYGDLSHKEEENTVFQLSSEMQFVILIVLMIATILTFFFTGYFWNCFARTLHRAKRLLPTVLQICKIFHRLTKIYINCKHYFHPETENLL